MLGEFFPPFLFFTGGDFPKQCAKQLPLAELRCNATYPSAVGMTPFKEATYGIPSPTHLPYLVGGFPKGLVDRSGLARELTIQPLKHHLLRSQHQMVPLANKEVKMSFKLEMFFI